MPNSSNTFPSRYRTIYIKKQKSNHINDSFLNWNLLPDFLASSATITLNMCLFLKSILLYQIDLLLLLLECIRFKKKKPFNYYVYWLRRNETNNLCYPQIFSIEETEIFINLGRTSEWRTGGKVDVCWTIYSLFMLSGFLIVTYSPRTHITYKLMHLK